MKNEEIAKSLIDLIDETIGEIEELKKSKFSAAEIKIEGPGEGIAGKPVNGDLDAKKAEAEEKEKKEKEEKEKKDKQVEKGVLDEAEMKKKEQEEKESAEQKKKEEEEAKKGKFSEKDEDVKKSSVEAETLMKSYVDSKLSPIESKLSEIVALVNKIGEQPVDRKSVPAGIVPLKKNDGDEVQPLTKKQVVDKLFELKKSGTSVDTLDIVKAETGSLADVQQTVIKYGLK